MFENIFSTTLMAAGKVGQSPVAQQVQPSIWETVPYIMIFFAAMYFIMIRPQAKKAKEQSEMLSKLKPGDEVVTAGGIIGRIKNINNDFFSVDTGSAVIKVTKNSVSHLTRPSSKK